jgi:hypothetical protein
MPCITVTINTPSGGPFQLSQLFAGNTYGGDVTIEPATPPQPPSKCTDLQVQGDPENASNLIYTGDQNLTPAVSGCIGQSLPANQVQKFSGETPLVGVFINASAGTAKANIWANGGFQ